MASAATVISWVNASTGIARAELGLRDGSVGQNDREGHGDVSAAAQIGEFESERRPIEVQLEAVRERPARLAQRSGNARDSQVGCVVEVLRGQVDDGPVLDDAARVDSSRSAANQADKVRVVDMQIDGGTAASSGIGDLARPVGLRNHAHQMSRSQGTIASGLNGLEGKGKLGEEGQDVARP